MFCSVDHIVCRAFRVEDHGRESFSLLTKCRSGMQSQARVTAYPGASDSGERSKKEGLGGEMGMTNRDIDEDVIEYCSTTRIDGSRAPGKSGIQEIQRQ